MRSVTSCTGMQGLCNCRGHTFPVWDVASSPHGYYFASASADKTGRVWCTERVTPLRILAGKPCSLSQFRDLLMLRCTRHMTLAKGYAKSSCLLAAGLWVVCHFGGHGGLCLSPSAKPHGSLSCIAEVTSNRQSKPCRACSTEPDQQS